MCFHFYFRKIIIVNYVVDENGQEPWELFLCVNRERERKPRSRVTQRWTGTQSGKDRIDRYRDKDRENWTDGDTEN